jgi:Soluble lytic murein transglycosylase and related regulatory proteins (some contain LysM/invasin domains)
LKKDRKTINELVQLYSSASNVNSCVVKGIIKQENTYNSISETNDVGLMGVNIQSAKDICKIKGTSEEIAQQLLDPEQNLACGTKILALKQSQYGKWEGIRRYNGYVDNQKHKYYISNKNYRENVLRKAIEEDCKMRRIILDDKGQKSLWLLVDYGDRLHAVKAQKEEILGDLIRKYVVIGGTNDDEIKKAILDNSSGQRKYLRQNHSL